MEVFALLLLFAPWPNHSTSPCSLPAGPGKAQGGEGWLAAALFPLPTSAGNGLLFIYKSQWEEGFQGRLSFPEL